MKVTIQDSKTSVTVRPRDFKVTVSGARGPQGDAGVGIAAGGAEGQILAKASATDYDTEWIDNYAVNVEVYVKNSSGSPMTKGQVVYISGADGTNPTISLAIATSEMGSSKTIGWLKQDLTNGAFGYVITEGLLEGINTNSATAAGDPIWLSPTTAGGVVYGLASKPSAPNHLVFLGYVLRKQTNNGKVYVKVQNGFELGELHDVYNGTKTTPVSADALLLRDSADNNLWKRLTWTNALAGVKSHMDTFKSVAGGYASLDGSGKVPSSELPSYVDDVVEVASFAALPVTGETGKIYVTLDTNKCYRWSGSVYIQVAQGIDTLTTTGTSGAATLVGSTLNIPQYQGVLTNPVTGTGTAGQVSYWDATATQTGSNSLFWDAANNRLGVGLNTGLTARAHVRGSGTTSATTALLVQNSTPSELFKVRDDGSISIGNAGATAPGMFAATTGGGTINLSGTNLQFVSFTGAQAATSGAFLFMAGLGSMSQTSGSQVFFSLSSGFTPTSGTADFSGLRYTGTINQTGGANGITRGLYLNPTLTAAADWRSVEFSNNTGWGIYGAGTANNYLGGRLGIGTSTLTNATVRNDLTLSGATTSYGYLSLQTVLSSVTSSARFFHVEPSTQNTTFTLTDLRYYSATQGIFGVNSSVTSQFGFRVANNLTGATNNYAFYGDIPSGTGSWNLYMNGTAANYLAGNTSIGTTTSSGRLTVRGSGTTSATNGLLVEDSAGTDTFTIRDDGGYAFRGGTVGLAQTGYTTFTNLTTDRTCDANATTVEELADILGTLIEDLKTKGIIAA